MIENTISVVIPYYKNIKNIDLIIKSLLIQTYPANEIIVVDDASPDDISGLIPKAASIRYIRRENNSGVAVTRNVGLSYCSSDITVFIDSDAIPEPSMIEAIIQTYIKYGESIVGVGGRAVECRVNTIFDTWRALHVSQDYGYSDRNNVPFLFGVCCSYKTEWLRDFGGFSPLFTDNVGEDYELGLRIKEKGLKTAYSPNVIVNHQRVDSLETLTGSQYLWSYWGVFAAKLHDKSILFPILGHLGRFIKYILHDLFYLRRLDLVGLDLAIFKVKFKGIIDVTKHKR